MLKLGTCLYNFIWEDSLTDAIRRAARLGFGALEIMSIPPQLDARAFDDRLRDEVREAVHDTGVEIVSINPTFIDINLASRSDAFRRESVREIKAAVDVAAALGAPIAVVGPGRRHPLVLEPLELSDRLAHPAIRECIDYAADQGVVVGLENLTNLYKVHASELAAFVDEVGSPSCKVVFDVANARCYEDPSAAIRLLGDRICHVHLSDCDGTAPAHLPVGRGDIDFGAVADALREIDYSGWSFLETTWMEDPDLGITTSTEALEKLGWQR